MTGPPSILKLSEDNELKELEFEPKYLEDISNAILDSRSYGEDHILFP